MQSKVVQCQRPQDLKEEVDFIITADSPTFMQVTETSSKTWYLIIWN